MAFLAQLVDDVVVHKFELLGSKAIIGRRPDCNIVVDDSAVSGHHAEIEIKPNQHFSQFLEFHLKDLESTNGTFVNDSKISEVQRLRNNDVIRVAWNSFKFIDDEEADLEKTVQMLQD